MSETLAERTETIDRDLREYGYPPILCQAHVAKIIGVDSRTVRRYQAEGILEPLRPTRHVRYRRREVARFLATRA